VDRVIIRPVYVGQVIIIIIIIIIIIHKNVASSHNEYSDEQYIEGSVRALAAAPNNNTNEIEHIQYTKTHTCGDDILTISENNRFVN